jgi:hypothetical protein
MALRFIAKKVFRTLARVIPQCGMVSQAVAFNMFLAFFSSLLVALGLMSNSLRGKNGPELVVRLSAILPPGSWQLVSEFLTSREVNPWNWVVVGWVGTLVVGSQVMKLIMEGIHLIYCDAKSGSLRFYCLRGSVFNLGNLAHSCLSNDSLIVAGGRPDSVGRGPGRIQLHALQAQAAKEMFSSQTSSLAIERIIYHRGAARGRPS